MGIVESIDKHVKNVKIDDRVVVSASICLWSMRMLDKKAFFNIQNEIEWNLNKIDCKTGMFSLCDQVTKRQISLKKRFFALLRGYDGCQAEWVRVPFVDINLLKIENDRLTDEQVLFLSDIVCTGTYIQFHIVLNRI